MTPEKIQLLKETLEKGVSTGVAIVSDSTQPRTRLRCWFEELGETRGPIFTVGPTGLHRHQVGMEFAAFSGNCIEQMQGASPERSIVAHALIAQLAISNRVVIRPEQPLDDWRISDARFAFTIEVSNVESPASDGAFAKTAEEVMVPLMAAMAELIGYEEDPATLEYDTEGHTQEQTVIRRERSRRNRLLCLSLHGRCCKVCGMSPDKQYGEAGSIIEVHHLEPVSVLAQPRPYDPRTDLIPLCPSCHRAVHVKKPVPYTPEELREILARAK